MLPDEKNLSGIIFSRNRAMQLDAVLRSFFLHCQDASLVDLSVLYLATSENFQRQYEQLIRAYPGVHFLQQTVFRKDVLNWLDPYPARSLSDLLYRSLVAISGAVHGQNLARKVVKKFFPFLFGRLLPPISERFYLFLVDDNIFVRDFSFTPMVEHFRREPAAIGCSLRLGKNTTYCYAHNSNQALPEFTNLSTEILRFKWVHSEHDFRYPLELSSSVYRGRQIVPFLLNLNFKNPNQMEGEMAGKSAQFSKTHPDLLCFETSVTFCNPINIVQTIENNRVGEKSENSVDQLAARFDAGERIDVHAYSGLVPGACHQEVDLVFKKYGGDA